MQVDGNCQQKRPIIELIREKLSGKGFTNETLRLQMLIQSLIHDEKKYDLVIDKFAGIISKLVADQY